MHQSSSISPWPQLIPSFSVLAPLILINHLILPVDSSPVPSQFGDWLHGQLLPKAGVTLVEEIKCYGLPYGGIGFVSHILTYYTAYMIVLRKSPLLPRPGTDLQHSRIGFALGLLSLIGTVPITAMTMGACRYRWQLVCIGVWKLTMSFTFCTLCFHQSILLAMEGTRIDHRRQGKIMLWFFLYHAGTIVGMVGLLDLVSQLFSQSRDIRIITGVFGGATLLILLLYTFFITVFTPKFWGSHSSLWNFFLGANFLYFFFGAFYSDCILAAISRSWSGAPSSDIAIIYWVHFAAKRLPLLSF